MSVTLETPLPDDQWTRDVTAVIAAWTLGTLVAIVLLFTVVRGLFV